MLCESGVLFDYVPDHWATVLLRTRLLLIYRFVRYGPLFCRIKFRPLAALIRSDWVALSCVEKMLLVLVTNYPMEHCPNSDILDPPYLVHCHLPNHCLNCVANLFIILRVFSFFFLLCKHFFLFKFLSYRSWPILSSFSSFLATLCEPRNFSFSSSVKSRYLQ